MRARGPRRARSRLTAAQVEDLLYGNPFAGPAGTFDSEEARRAAWFAHRLALFDQFELQEPPAGQRHPQGYLDFEDLLADRPTARQVRGRRILTREELAKREASRLR